MMFCEVYKSLLALVLAASLLQAEEGLYDKYPQCDGIDRAGIVDTEKKGKRK